MVINMSNKMTTNNATINATNATIGTSSVAVGVDSLQTPTVMELYNEYAIQFPLVVLRGGYFTTTVTLRGDGYSRKIYDYTRLLGKVTNLNKSSQEWFNTTLESDVRRTLLNEVMSEYESASDTYSEAEIDTFVEEEVDKRVNQERRLWYSEINYTLLSKEDGTFRLEISSIDVPSIDSPIVFDGIPSNAIGFMPTKIGMRSVAWVDPEKAPGYTLKPREVDDATLINFPIDIGSMSFTGILLLDNMSKRQTDRLSEIIDEGFRNGTRIYYALQTVERREYKLTVWTGDTEYEYLHTDEGDSDALVLEHLNPNKFGLSMIA